MQMIALCVDVEVANLKSTTAMFEETMLKLDEVDVVVVMSPW